MIGTTKEKRTKTRKIVSFELKRQREKKKQEWGILQYNRIFLFERGVETFDYHFVIHRLHRSCSLDLMVQDQGGEPVHQGRLLPCRTRPEWSGHRRFTGNDQPVHRTAGRTGRTKLLDQHGCHELVGKRKYRAAGAGTDLPAEVSESRHHHYPGISGGSI